MAEDVLKNMRIEMFAQVFGKGPKGEPSLLQHESDSMAKEIIALAEKRNKLMPKAAPIDCIVASVSEMFTKLQILQNVRVGLLERMIEALAESMEGNAWAEAMKRISKLELKDVIRSEK